MANSRAETIVMTVEITAAYVANNALDSEELPNLIRSIHRTLAAVAGEQAALPPEPLMPAVPIKKSITPDYLVCLEDGRRFKSLKRHLRSKYNLTPEAYRARWGLSTDYPMVAPNYAAARSNLAKAMGLGVGDRKRSETGEVTR